MAKRFNPRKKTWEYNIKWENFGQYVLTFLDFNIPLSIIKLITQNII